MPRLPPTNNYPGRLVESLLGGPVLHPPFAAPLTENGGMELIDAAQDGPESCNTSSTKDDPALCQRIGEHFYRSIRMGTWKTACPFQYAFAAADRAALGPWKGLPSSYHPAHPESGLHYWEVATSLQPAISPARRRGGTGKYLRQGKIQRLAGKDGRTTDTGLACWTSDPQPQNGLFRRSFQNMADKTNVQRLPAESCYAGEIDALHRQRRPIPSPPLAYVPRSGASPTHAGERRGIPSSPPSTSGHQRLVEIPSPPGHRPALLLIGSRAPQKLAFEHLTAAINGDSTRVIQGTASTTEEQIR